MTASEFIFVRSNNKWCFNRESRAAFIPSAHPSDPLVPRSKMAGRFVFFSLSLSKQIPPAPALPSLGGGWREKKRESFTLCSIPPQKKKKKKNSPGESRSCYLGPTPPPAIGYYTIEEWEYTTYVRTVLSLSLSLSRRMGCRWMDYTHRRHSRPQPDGHSHSHRVHGTESSCTRFFSLAYE